MQYCENCRAVTDKTYCPLCGAKKLRLVSDGDYCLLTEEGTADSENSPFPLY